MNAMKFCKSELNSLGPCALFSRWILTNSAREMYWMYARLSSLGAMASDGEGFGHHWKRIIEGRQRGDYPLSPQCVRLGLVAIVAPPRQESHQAVLSEFDPQYLTFWLGKTSQFSQVGVLRVNPLNTL
jgi:hypothetical protein